MHLFFDTETTGLPRFSARPASATDNWPRLVSLGWALFTKEAAHIASGQMLVIPDGFTIPAAATAIHGITTRQALQQGVALTEALLQFSGIAAEAQVLAAHNFNYDFNVLKSELLRCGLPDVISNKQQVCTMESTAKFCGIPGLKGFKYPTLAELHYSIFKTALSGAHNALADAEACARCFWELKRLQIL